MKEAIFISSSLDIFFLFIAILAVFFLLRLFDRLSGIEFKNVFTAIQNNAMAAALYFGLRFIGVCLLVSTSLS